MIVFLFVLRRRGRSLSYLFCFSLFWVYLLAVAAVTLFPMPIPGVAAVAASRDSAAYILSRVNLVPFDYSQFKYLGSLFVFIREILANIILTMPFGFLVSFVVHIRVRSIPWLALAVGVGIEAAQLGMSLILGSNYRGVDINDSLMNALGVVCGYGLFRIYSRQHRFPTSFL